MNPWKCICGSKHCAQPGIKYTIGVFLLSQPVIILIPIIPLKDNNNGKTKSRIDKVAFNSYDLGNGSDGHHTYSSALVPTRLHASSVFESQLPVTCQCWDDLRSTAVWWLLVIVDLPTVCVIKSIQSPRYVLSQIWFICMCCFKMNARVKFVLFLLLHKCLKNPISMSVTSIDVLCHTRNIFSF